MSQIRSPIFVPGNRQNMLEKAKGFVTDWVVPDLEDSVPPAEKDNARRVVREMAPLLAEHGQQVMVRINSLETGLSEKDINSVTGPGVAAISVGKINRPEDVREYARLISAAESSAGVPDGSTKLTLWIENASAVHFAYEIARASERVMALTFGAEDYTSSLGLQRTEDGEELYFPRATLALAAHAAGVTPLDTPYVNFRNQEGLRNEIIEVRKLGFKGKFAIHPAQIEVIRQEFNPSQDEIEYARRVVEGWNKAEAEGRGSFDLDGKMVDVPVVERARRLLAEVEEHSAV